MLLFDDTDTAKSSNMTFMFYAMKYSASYQGIKGKKWKATTLSQLQEMVPRLESKLFLNF